MIMAGCWSDANRPDQRTLESMSVRVPYFSALRLAGHASVDIEVGPLRSVVVSGSPEQVRRVVYDMRSDELHILTPGISDSAGTGPAVRITTPDLMALRLTGSGDMTLTGTLRRPDFEVYNAGSGRISITTGSVDLLAVRVLRTGSVDTYGLTANQVHARINGRGSARVYARHAVNVDNTGRGHLKVHGLPPERNLRITGRHSPPVEFPED
jgi:hypothetical protein